jgi:quercetin dioxygenase-like cupin family protein
MQVLRWQEAVAPQEQELYQRMQRDGLRPYAWSNGPGESYAVHSHHYEKVLYCVRGSIRFVLPDQADVVFESHPSNAADASTNGQDGYKEVENMGAIDLSPGDCLILPKGVRHGAQVGPRGVTCLEAAR